MLGHTGAGKTSYMASMYRAMIDGVGGFSVRATTTDAHDRLLALAEGVRTGHYPPGTAQHDAYDLTLRHHRADLTGFRWQDYRGAALRDRSTEEQARQLVRDLAEADGIVVFADALQLVSEAVATVRMARIMLLLTDALAGRVRRTPVVLALTKWDLVAERHSLDEVAAPFGTLVRAIENSETVCGMIAPISCGPRPMNVVLPVLWCLHVGVAADAQRSWDEAEVAGRAAVLMTVRAVFGGGDWGALARREAVHHLSATWRSVSLADNARHLSRLVAAAGVPTF